jgi:4-amino-4-deoxy-L-arabinose transferase-like glycosyltransferase
VGLLSSLPHAAVIAIVFLLVSSLTKRTFIGLFSALLLLANYLFFLYSVTPEVFALLDLFVILLLYLLVRWRQTGDDRLLLTASFVFGLSLTHHHVILFFVPAVIYWLWGKRLRISMLVWFLAGLVPYTYVFVAARAHSVINWDRPVDLAGFIRLVTRADYGTFVAGGWFGSLVTQRFLQIQAYGQFVRLDFTWIGILLLFVGFFSLWKHNRRLGIFFFLALLCLGPLFFFYASFPLINRFTLGTYERFLLPSYVLFAVLAGIGLSELADRVRSVVSRRLARLVLGVGCIVILLYPLSQLGMTIWRFYGMPADRTGDNLGKDILSPLPWGSILFLNRDMTLFSVQYVRYALNFRPDIIAIHTSRLNSPDYQITLHAIFPDITFEASGDATLRLVETQHSTKRIFTNTPINVGAGWYWVPYGLTYELVDESHQPSAGVMYEQNLAIWKTMHDPLSGILSRYNHLMLSDARDVYAGARIALGTPLKRAGMLDEAYSQFSVAVSVAGDGELTNAYTNEGLTLLLQKKCTEALTAFDAAKKSSLVPDSNIIYYEASTYRDCVGDAGMARKLFDEYAKAKDREETPINLPQ